MKKPTRSARPRVRILLGSAIAMGPGKADLLEAIDETGSISAAARRMRTSYRRPFTLGGVGSLLLVVAVIAMYVPARRAMRVAPIVALNES